MKTLLATSLLLLAGLVLADANEGEMGGYRLGDIYPLNDASRYEAVADRSWKIKAQQAVVPADMDSAYVYATPATQTIGKIIFRKDFASAAEAEAAAMVQKQRLEAAYPDWEVLKAPIPMGRQGGAMVSRQRQGAYALIVFYKSTDDGAELVVELEFESSSPERKAWRAQLKAEATAGTS